MCLLMSIISLNCYEIEDKDSDKIIEKETYRKIDIQKDNIINKYYDVYA